MSSQTAIRPCTTFTTTKLSTLYPLNSILHVLTDNTTKKEFALIAQKIKEAGFSLSDGDEDGRSLVYLAATVNHAIFRTISKEYIRDPELLTSRGTKMGVTPLHGVAVFDQIETAYTLISLGSPINLTTTSVITTMFDTIPKGATPLDLAIRMKRSISMIGLLKINGGKRNVYFEKGYEDTCRKIDQLVDQDIAKVESAARLCLKNQFNFLNKDVVGIIVGYFAEYKNFIEFN